MRRIDSLLLAELSSLLAREEMENMMITITRVKTSKSLQDAEVYFTVMPPEKRGSAGEILRKKAREWQGEIGGKLDIMLKRYDKKQESFWSSCFW